MANVESDNNDAAPRRASTTIEPLSSLDREKRAEAIARLKEGIHGMNFRSSGPLPSRDELHERERNG